MCFFCVLCFDSDVGGSGICAGVAGGGAVMSAGAGAGNGTPDYGQQIGDVPGISHEGTNVGSKTNPAVVTPTATVTDFWKNLMKPNPSKRPKKRKVRWWFWWLWYNNNSISITVDTSIDSPFFSLSTSLQVQTSSTSEGRKPRKTKRDLSKDLQTDARKLIREFEHGVVLPGDSKTSKATIKQNGGKSILKVPAGVFECIPKIGADAVAGGFLMCSAQVK